MAGLINVDGSDDPSYRYKMPRLVSKVEGRGNGVKTVLVNCADVAAALNRSTAQLTKFFGCEMGAMTKYEEKIERSLVNGAFDNKVLQEALTDYIQKFVLCPSCGNPETVQELKGKKKQAVVQLNCKACGATEDADNAHKLVTFIIKEQSPEEGLSKKEKRKKKKKEKNDAECLNKKKNSADGSDVDRSDGETEVKKKKKKKKDKERDPEREERRRLRREKRERKAQEKENQNAVNGVATNGEKTSEISSSDSDGIPEAINGLSIYDVTALESAVCKLQAFMKENNSNESLIEQIIELQVACGLEKREQVPLLFYSIVNNENGLSKILESIKLLSSVNDSAGLDTNAFMMELLLCLEETVVRVADETQRTALRKMIPVILKTAYDEDLLDESIILAWYQGTLGEDFVHQRYKVDKDEVKLMKKEAKPVVTWFQEAESGSEADDNDEED